MAAQVRLRDTSGTLQAVTRIRARDDGGVLRTVQRIRVRDASNVLRTVWQALTAAISPNSSDGTYNGSSALDQDITTGSVIAVPTGGIAPYTYSWAQGLSAYTWTIGASTSQSTGFTAQAVGPGAVATADFTVTVTDSGGAEATATVTARAINQSTV